MTAFFDRLYGDDASDHRGVGRDPDRDPAAPRGGVLPPGARGAVGAVARGTRGNSWTRSPTRLGWAAAWSSAAGLGPRRPPSSRRSWAPSSGPCSDACCSTADGDLPANLGRPRRARRHVGQRPGRGRPRQPRRRVGERRRRDAGVRGGARIAPSEKFAFGEHDPPGAAPDPWLPRLDAERPRDRHPGAVHARLAVLRPRGRAEWLAVAGHPSSPVRPRGLFDLLGVVAPRTWSIVRRRGPPWDDVADARLADLTLRRPVLTITTNHGRRRGYTVLRAPTRTATVGSVGRGGPFPRRQVLPWAGRTSTRRTGRGRSVLTVGSAP